ncbi:MAG: DNA polymerase IV [Patescibacteria group bacterium]
MKKILHVDMNSYFATLEQQAHPNLRGKPIGVAGKGDGLPATPGLAWRAGERTVVCAASIEAKEFGVKSGMGVWEALRLCPQLIVIPATYDRYSYTSKRIFDLLEKFAPKVDIFSIDEAFLELPARANSKLQALDPKQIENLKNQISKHWDLGFGIWDFSNPENCAYLDAVITALQIKRLIRTEIGEWVSCSIGISYGRVLAKLAGEMQKPNGLTVITPEDFPKIAAITPIEELCGIGWALRPRLNRMGITTIADLGRMPEDMLVTVFGRHTGEWLYRIGNGIDDDILHSWRNLPEEKSIGHSYTLPRDIASLSDVKSVLLLLSERVGRRLRHHHLTGKTISIYLRFGDNTGWGARHSQKEYLLDGYQIYQAGVRQLNSLESFGAVRLIAISVSDLVEAQDTTAPLFANSRTNEQLINAVDRLNNRYGEWTVHRGVLHKIKSRIFNLPDGRDKRKFLPEITHVNPFTKRI